MVCSVPDLSCSDPVGGLRAGTLLLVWVHGDLAVFLAPGRCCMNTTWIHGKMSEWEGLALILRKRLLRAQECRPPGQRGVTGNAL